MKLNASSYYTLYRPSPCDLRLYLRAKGTTEGKPSPYEEVIIKLGRRYEADYVGTLGEVVDLSTGSEDDRVTNTIQAVKQGAQSLYHPLLRFEAKLSGRTITLVGEPDLLIKMDGGYCIRDVKLSRRITEKDHPEILLQLGMYAWLFEATFGTKPKRLEVLAGTGKMEEVSIALIERAQQEARHIVEIALADKEPFSPVGWTKCGSCGFHDHCWTPAVDRKHVATVPGVDQGLARALHERDVITIEDLLARFDQASLAEVQKPWGKGTQKVGKAAEKILRFARAIASGKEEILQEPTIRSSENYAMLDLEGLPPQLDELDKVYLWGLQVFGQKPSDYMGKIAATGQEGDRAGWEGFLEAGKAILNSYGNVPFVHWHHYERTKINAYLERYGDKDGVADRIKENMLDLLPITQASIALPISSYSLKVVEQYIGYKRSQTEYGGDWSMATFIMATETADEKQRHHLLDAILTYNREDLAATWAVLQWLKSKKQSV